MRTASVDHIEVPVEQSHTGTYITCNFKGSSMAFSSVGEQQLCVTEVTMTLFTCLVNNSSIQTKCFKLGFVSLEKMFTALEFLLN